MSVSLPRPPWSALGRRLESLMRKALYEHALLEGVSKVCVALSGGKDSLSLLFLLHAIRGRGFPAFDLYAAHVNGAFTCGAGVQLDYLQAVCTELKVPLIVQSSQQKLDSLACYSCSRERRKLLFDAAKSVGATTIAFGHHRDDSAQTLLMNLLHKAEFECNLPKVPMHAYGVTIIRPLILASEKELRQFAQQQGFARVTCRCPVGENSMRRQVEELLQQMETLFPNARANIAQAGLQYSSGKAKHNQ